jgi:hypothetical protein
MNNHESLRRDARCQYQSSTGYLGLIKALLLGAVCVVLGIFAFTCIVGLLGCLAWLSRTFGGS